MEEQRSVFEDVISSPSTASSARLADVHRATHQTIQRVTHDLDQDFQFNTAIAALMEFVNQLYKLMKDAPLAELSRDERAGWRSAIESLLLLLSPFAPHIAEELWEMTGHASSIARQPWPVFNPDLVVSDEWTIPIQVNGKLRSKITVKAGTAKDQIIAMAQGDDKLQEWVQGKTARKVIYVEQKLVNFVI